MSQYDITESDTSSDNEFLDLPENNLLPTTRHITNLNLLSLDVIDIPLWNMALQAHYEKNTHHPEHFTDPSQMDELSRKHMLCNLLATVWAMQRKNTFYDTWTLSQIADYCRSFRPEWKFVQDLYKGTYEAHIRLPHFKCFKKYYVHEKRTFHFFVKSFLRNTIGTKEFTEGLYYFQSVRDYLRYLQWHQQTIVEVGKATFPDDEELHAALATHDEDLWDALMVAAHVWKWLFGEETFRLDERFNESEQYPDGKCNACEIFHIVEYGKEEKKQWLNKNKIVDEVQKSLDKDEPLTKLLKTESSYRFDCKMYSHVKV